MRRAAILGGGLLLLATVVPLGCDVPPPEGESDSDPVLAEISGEPIRRSDVDAKLATLPRMAHSDFAGEIGRTRMLRQMIEEEILHRAAVDGGVGDDPGVRQALEDHRRRVLVQAYLDREREEATRVTDEEVLAFYEANPEEYRVERALRVRLLLNSDSTKVQRGREMAVAGTLPFDQVCARFSEPDYLIEAEGEIPSWVRKDLAVPWIGNHREFHAAAFALEEGEISEPFATRIGWMVVQVEEVREESVRPLDDVRDDIVGRLARTKSVEGLPALLDRLRTRYAVVEHAPPGRSAEELFLAAQSSPRPQERVELYEELLERYPEHGRAVEARFMLGFLLSEELGDRDAAATHFRRLVDEHPDSELAQSARWMLSSESERTPALEAEPSTGETSQETTP